ncbi:hypothetical protein [Mycoplasmopsis arginini]|uniref:hypothetical protein n=1 Tax=Mycoplasmopsis arginini TaxID=2094 RepID=UPI00249D9EDE|nr:hypothetical protein [Mycoplasmopsis arginini]MDI3350475.1 hypothetical protein [Mycoplasmopsis arginini]MDI3350813.1 hypothetical protein [Mycoplasmopsis arginini]
MDKNKIINWLDISLENYNNYSNISNNFFIPAKLKRFYNEENEEEIAQCFVNVVCSIFSQIDLIVGLRISWALENTSTKEDFSRLISEFRKNNLKKAIYEEINFRLLSNSFPEFNNRQDLISNNINKIGLGKDYSTIESLLSPLAAGYIISSAWNKIELESRANNISYFDFLDKIIKKLNDQVLELKTEISKIDEKIINNINWLDQIQETLMNTVQNTANKSENDLQILKTNTEEQFSEQAEVIVQLGRDVTLQSEKITNNINKIRTLETTTENKADKNNVYSKSEIDTRLRTVTSSQTINNGNAKSPNDCRKIGIFAGNFLATGSPNSTATRGTIINLTTKYDSQGTFLQFFISENEKIFMRTYINNSYTSWQQLGLMNFDGRVLKIKL